MTEFAQKLREETAAVRLSKTAFGMHRSLKKSQVEQAAAVFGAEGSVVKMRKRLLNTKCDEFRAVSTTISNAIGYWHSVTVPYPERGIRLIRRSLVQEFTAKMGEFAARLEVAVKSLDGIYQGLVDDAKTQLGELFNAADYPPSMDGRFSLECDFPSVSPPNYLKEINPELYEAESKKIQARFQEAVLLTEAAFAQEFSGLVNSLTDKLAAPDAESGKRKVLRDTAVTNFAEFFKKFDQLSIGGDTQLEKLIAQAKDLLQGADPEKLRKDVTSREAMRSSFATVKAGADNLVTARSRIFTIDED